MKVNFLGTRGSMSMGTPINKLIDNSQEMANYINDQFNGDIQKFKESKEWLDFLELGSDTISVLVESEDEEDFLIIDCGTGLTKANEIFFDRYSLNESVHIFFTHFHWDHIVGLPFFLPLFMPGREVNFYSPDKELANYVKSLFRKPFFPVDFDSLPSQINFHTLELYEKNQIAGFEVTAYCLDHPDPCFGYKVEEEGKSYSHCVDTEAVRVSASELGKDAELYQNSDLMFFDAPYTLEEVEGLRKGWGHSCCERAMELMKNFNIKKTFIGHYTPDFTLEKRKLLQRVMDEGGVDISFSYDGMTIHI